MTDKELKKTTMENRIKIIKDFAFKMGYEVYIDEYESCRDGRPMISIELSETYDGDGNPYSWAWYTDTYEELK